MREDIITNGAEILGRPMTETEIDEAEAAMEARLDEMYEDYDEEEVDIMALFNEDFYDNLKNVLEEMQEEQEQEN